MTGWFFKRSISLAFAVLASTPMLVRAQAQISIYNLCVNASPDLSSKLKCEAQREAAAAGLRQSLRKAGIALEPDALMIDEYQRTGRWDLMRALRLSQGRRVGQ